ncbi:PRC-barrel domain containing protein [Salinigranum sp. GCM10025319]|uniref:PRC-barrel domain containing protein n=1 Tax=Salinigranum sp. GCM10025319 TaxID=3252687 RepID=UPI00360EAB25
MAQKMVTEDDEGKRVVDSHGDTVGMVSEIKNGTAYVDPDPGITDKIRSKLGWGDADKDHYPLKASRIDMVTDDEIRLKSNL